MRRTQVGLVVLALMAFGLAGCGNGSAPVKAHTTPPATSAHDEDMPRIDEVLNCPPVQGGGSPLDITQTDNTAGPGWTTQLDALDHFPMASDGGTSTFTHLEGVGDDSWQYWVSADGQYTYNAAELFRRSNDTGDSGWIVGAVASCSVQPDNLPSRHDQDIDLRDLLQCPKVDGELPQVVSGDFMPANGELSESPQIALQGATAVLAAPVDQYRLISDQLAQKVYAYEVKGAVLAWVSVDQVGENDTWAVGGTAECLDRG